MSAGKGELTWTSGESTACAPRVTVARPMSASRTVGPGGGPPPLSLRPSVRRYDDQTNYTQKKQAAVVRFSYRTGELLFRVPGPSRGARGFLRVSTKILSACSGCPRNTFRALKKGIKYLVRGKTVFWLASPPHRTYNATLVDGRLYTIVDSSVPGL